MTTDKTNRVTQPEGRRRSQDRVPGPAGCSRAHRGRTFRSGRGGDFVGGAATCCPDHHREPTEPERVDEHVVLVQRAGRSNVRVQARRRLVRNLHERKELLGPRARKPHLPRPGQEVGRYERGDDLHLVDRSPDRLDHERSRRPGQLAERIARVHGGRGGRDVRVQARLTDVRGVHQPEELLGPRCRIAHLPGSGQGQRRDRSASNADLDDRPDRTRRADRNLPAPSAAWTQTASPAATFTGEAGGTFQCKLDSGSFAACTSPKAYSGLSQGSHTFQVKQTDAAGNTGHAGARTFQIDSIAPTQPVFTQKPPDPQQHGDLDVRLVLHRPGAGERHRRLPVQQGERVLPALLAPATRTTVQTTNNGQHQFAVVAVDWAGNISQAATYKWKVAAGSHSRLHGRRQRQRAHDRRLEVDPDHDHEPK